MLLKQPHHPARLQVQVHIVEYRTGGQAGHGAHLAQQRVEEARPTQARISRIGTRKPFGTPFRVGSWLRLRWVLAMQSGSLSKPRRVYSSILRLCFGQVIHTICAVDFLADGLDLLFDGHIQRVEELEVAGLLSSLDHGLGQLDRTLAASSPVGAHNRVFGAGFHRSLADQLDFGRGIVLE